MKFNQFLLGVALMLSAVVTAAPKEETITLTDTNVIVVDDVVEGESVAKAIGMANAIEEKRSKSVKGRIGMGKSDPVYLFLNTPGGSIQAGLELIEALNGTGLDIKTVSLFSASMGFQLAQAFGDRYVLKNGILMSHRARGEVGGEFGGQDPSSLENRLALWRTRMNQLDAQTVARTKGKQTLESYQKAYASELWLTGSQAVEQGYADSTVLVKCDKSLNGGREKSISFFGLLISYEMSNCPLNTSPYNIRVGSRPRPSKDDDKTTKDKKKKEKEKDKKKEKGTQAEVESESELENQSNVVESDLSFEKIEEAKARFLENYYRKHKVPLPLYW